MTTILVVEDSPVDQRVVGSLLGKDTSLEIEYALDGAKALEKMEQAVEACFSCEC
jgi:CheY-like chemotaxis protein